MQLNYIVGVDLSEQLVALLNRRRGEAKGSDVVGKALAGKVTMDGGKLIQFSIDRTALPDFDHLSQLFIANEDLIYFEDSLLKYEIDWIPEYFL
jgi:hypothetical protein